MNRNSEFMTANINTIFEHLQLLLDKVSLFTWPGLAGEETKRVFSVSGTQVILINLFSY